MCDCYNQKCQRCERKFPIHLADWALNRRDIEVYCGRHLPQQNIVIETITNPFREDWPLRKGTRAGFRFRGELPNGYGYKDFCLNSCSESETVVIGNPVVRGLTDEALP